MIESNSPGFERQFKRLLPQAVKARVLPLLVNRLVGRLVQKICSQSLLGAKFDFSTVDPLVAARIYFSLWESAEIRFSKKHVTDGDTIIELGSSIGVTLATLCSTKRLRSYIGVEASPVALRILSSTIALFPSVDIVIFDRAISYCGEEKVGFLELTLTGSRLAGLSEGDQKSEKCHQIKVIQLNEIVANYLPEDENYVLISDIEGAEAEVFKMDAHALEKCKLIVCELADTERYTIEEQIILLKSRGFIMTEYYGNVYVFKQKITGQVAKPRSIEGKI